jgi:predicted glycogen debranching enzyme
MTAPRRSIAFPVRDVAAHSSREWIVTNGLGGYASGCLSGIVTRRYHGLLVSALPAPIGRMMMLSHADARLRLVSGATVTLEPQPLIDTNSQAAERATYLPLVEFRLEAGLPFWRYEGDGFVVEKRVLMPYRQNTVHVRYRMLQSASPVRLELRPYMHVRHYESSLREELPNPYTLTASEGRFEITAAQDLPLLRLLFYGQHSALTLEASRLPNGYLLEQSRGYEYRGTLWSPGYFQLPLDGSSDSADATLVASTESWEMIDALTPNAAIDTEVSRRHTLLAQAPVASQSALAAELVLAADQFLVSPAARPADATRAAALGTEARTVIAGYHWFTDWGRDTMISLEGLTLTTGRATEAMLILRTFASYVRDGLIPNMFPDGERDGLYHTADATLWFFHAVSRYVDTTGDRDTLRLLLPVLEDIVRHHIDGTRFGIGIDAADGLLRQGEEGYQLTWMDAKVDGWVVTPRRGKAVEINALFYNALRLLESWLILESAADRAQPFARCADRARESFNRRFWYEPGKHLYDVVDGELGDDPACRPNQLLAISLTHPILDETRWASVLDVVQQQLATPFGLRTLSPHHPLYQPRYDGDLRARDAAYHQGTVWPWLMGPFVDAWLKVHLHDHVAATALVSAFDGHLREGGIGTISEIFDAELPYSPRGCISQAWSVAEILRITKRLTDLE